MEEKWNKMTLVERRAFVKDLFVSEFVRGLIDKEWKDVPRFAKDRIIIQNLDLSR